MSFWIMKWHVSWYSILNTLISLIVLYVKWEKISTYYYHFFSLTHHSMNLLSRFSLNIWIVKGKSSIYYFHSSLLLFWSLYWRYLLLSAHHNCYCWWTCSWVEDDLEFQGSWSKVWQGKQYYIWIWYQWQFSSSSGLEGNNVTWLSSINCLAEHHLCLESLLKLPYLIFGFEQVELQYLHDYAGISSSIGLTANPVVNFSGVIGTSVVALGTDVSFDSKTGNFTKLNAGLSFSNADLIAALTLWVLIFLILFS